MNQIYTSEIKVKSYAGLESAVKSALLRTSNVYEAVYDPIASFVGSSLGNIVKNEKDTVRWKIRGAVNTPAKDSYGNNWYKMAHVNTGISEDIQHRAIGPTEIITKKITEALRDQKDFIGKNFNIKLDVDWFSPGDLIKQENTDKQLVVNTTAMPSGSSFEYSVTPLKQETRKKIYTPGVHSPLGTFLGMNK